MSLASEKCHFDCKGIPPLDESFVTFGSAEANPLPRESISILIWNIYKARKKNWAEDFGALLDGRHLVLIQEAILSEDLPKDYLLGFPYSWDLGISFFITKRRYPTGVMTGSSVQRIWAKIGRTVDREPFVRTPKMTLASLFDLEGVSRQLLVINIHGINWAGRRSLSRQLNQWDEKMASHEGPILFAGDFNTHSPYRMKSTQEFMSRHGLTQVSWKDDPRKSRFKILDHAFIRGLKVEKAEIHTDLKSSDHPALDLVVSLAQ